MDDVARLRAALTALEPDADQLDWAAQRPWRAATHVRWEGELPSLDLHDLNARLARRAVDALLGEAGALETGAVRVITGRGRRSMGPGVLGDLVRSRIGNQLEEGWRFHPSGAGAYVLITDARRAPRSATGALSPWFWFGVALAVGLLIYVLLT